MPPDPSDGELIPWVTHLLSAVFGAEIVDAASATDPQGSSTAG